uniref:Small ribosomal subunit protein uS5m n=1 Tax=Plectus sambesii TaxID=2011161 RepID=A0A914VHR1_9BILA
MGLSLIPFVSRRHNTVNFFMRHTAKELWNTITAISSAGKKKGRQATRQRPRDLNRARMVGQGVFTATMPGLNTTVSPDMLAGPAIDLHEHDPEIQKKVDSFHERSTKRSKERQQIKLHPLERGFSSGKVPGQKLGAPAPIDGQTFADFESYCLEMKRTSNMTGNMGRKHSMNALMVTGNGKGTAGWAVCKAPIHQMTAAIYQARQRAASRLVHVELLEDRTIYQDFYAECRNSRIWALRRPKGFGVVAHARLMKICELVGIKDIYIKVEGSSTNYQALTAAFFTGLINQESHQRLAERMRMHVVEMSRTTHYLPKIIASPIKSDPRNDDEILPHERITLDDFYGEGRYPLSRQKPEPFWVKSQQHQHLVWANHPFRNHEDVRIRLLADSVVPRWTRTERRKYAQNLHERAMNGIVPVPSGIGLSEYKLRPQS